MNQQVQVVSYMQVAKLQRSTERDYKRCVQCRLCAQRAFLCALIADSVLAFENTGR
jgi:hypothetical protein